ncbi:MAG TPA: FG-GAP-like repeat-containing protein, partial [Candidatus Polarisedimenticolaceae bacterium]|nr:FG-GAP-like repeat-containing protein [Candidatus Polarisedimenticolaceae bacterium]
NIAVDAGLGVDAVDIDAAGAFGEFELGVDLGADANEVAVEKLTLAYEHIDLNVHVDAVHQYAYAPGASREGAAVYEADLRSDGELVQAVYGASTAGGFASDQLSIALGDGRAGTVGNLVGINVSDQSATVSHNETITIHGNRTEAQQINQITAFIDGSLNSSMESSLAIDLGGDEEVFAEHARAVGGGLTGRLEVLTGAGDDSLLVDLSGNDAPTRAGFTEVSGLSTEITPVEYRLGAMPGDNVSLTVDMAGIDAFELITGDAADEIDLELAYPAVPVPTLRFATGGGNDVIGGTLVGVPGTLDLSLDTGAGDDDVQLEFTEAASIVTGAGAGHPSEVKAFGGATSVEGHSLTAYPGFTGGVRVATGDVNGDGVVDLVTGAGEGAGSHVKVFDGRTGAELRSFFAYPGFTGGVYVAAGDVDGDGYADIITGAGAGGGPHVKVFSGATGATLQSFFAYTPSFTGGVRVAAGDVNGDGFADIVTGAGPGGGSHVKVFDGLTSAEIRSFFAYPGFTGGVYVAAGDVNGDGLDDIVAGAGAGGPSHVKVFDGSSGGALHSFFAYSPSFTGGVRVAAGDVNGDGFADIVTGAGPGAGPHVKVFDGVTSAAIRSFFAYDPGFLGGVYVAAADVNPDASDAPAALNLAVNTAGGNDLVALEMASGASRSDALDIDLGTGSDRFALDWQGALQDPAVDVELDLQVAFGGAEAAALEGDECLVFFLGGVPDRPVVIGMVWNSQDNPPPDDTAPQDDKHLSLALSSTDGFLSLASALTGGAGSDDVRLFFRGTLEVARDAQAPQLSAVIELGDGNDSALVDFSALETGKGTKLAPVGVDLRGGAGVDALAITGTQGADAFTVTGRRVVLEGAGEVNYVGFEVLEVRTLGGDDRVTMTGIDPGTRTLIDGGEGRDTFFGRFDGDFDGELTLLEFEKLTF